MFITKDSLDKVYRSKLATVETMEARGYKLIEELFVDSCGLGSPDEPALVQSQFKIELLRILEENNGKVYASVTNAGQFQVYVGLFKKTGQSKSKKIGNNTYRVDLGDKEAIRLHDTNILVFEGDHVTLNSGGWLTRTTKDRMNKYLPVGVTIDQKAFKWFINDRRSGTVIKFYDGITIAN